MHTCKHIIDSEKQYKYPPLFQLLGKYFEINNMAMLENVNMAPRVWDY